MSRMLTPEMLFPRIVLKCIFSVIVLLQLGCGGGLESSGAGLASPEILSLNKTQPSIDRTVNNVITLDGQDVFVSRDIYFEIADDVVSYVLLIEGRSIGVPPTFTSMHTLTSPSGTEFENLNYESCGLFYCVVSVPRDVNLKTEAGVWRLTLSGAVANGYAYSGEQFSDLNVTVASNNQFGIREIEIAPFVVSHHLEPEAISQTMIALKNYTNTLGFRIKVLEPRILSGFPEEIEVNPYSPEAIELSRHNYAEKVNLYLVGGFKQGTNAQGVAGFAAGTPGTLGFATTGMSIYVDALSNFPSSQHGPLNSGNNPGYATYSAAIIVHEIGHLLGLDHTSERDGSGNDLHADTPACTLVNDVNNNGMLDADECSDLNNLMFWTFGNQLQRTLSFQQKRVILNNPLQHKRDL